MTTRPAPTLDRAKRRPSRKKPPDPDNITWGTSASLTAVLLRSGWTFSATILPSPFGEPGWHVIGVVAPSPEIRQSSAESLSAILAQHAHQQLGVFDELDGEAGAMQAVRRFLCEAAVPVELCECTELLPPDNVPQASP